MTLTLHRAERADTLLTHLGEQLSVPQADPFAAELVCVPTPGVERWLAQGLSTRLGAGPGRDDGVCAGVDFCSPRRLVALARRSVAPDAGAGAAAEPDPWLPGRSVWPLLQVIDASRGEGWSELLWDHLGGAEGALDPIRSGRRWSVARHLALLFARYAEYRPAMVRAWSDGRDVDQTGAPLPPDRAWQAELWRRLAATIPGPDPVRALAGTAERLRRMPGAADLPPRLSVFGVTRIQPVLLTVLLALAAHRDVHLWLPHPSPALWDRLEPALAGEGVIAARRRGDADPLPAARHPLLASLGRDSRELQAVLAAATADPGAPAVRHRHHAGPPHGSGTALARLQAAVAADLAPAPETDRPVLDPADRSIGFHASHGPDRQVEVLRELLVGLLADDPTLEPRDIVVMCPDIETYAPLLIAAFGLDGTDTVAEHPGHRLRVRLADRSLRQLNPLLAVVGRVVALADSRVEASVLLDLCAMPPVARRFGFSTDDLERLHELVSRSGVRWGLDRDHRGRFQMSGFGQNTWAAGLDRMLLGVAMEESGRHWIGTVLPLDDVDSGDVDLVGRLAEALDRVRRIVEACWTPRPVADWVTLLRAALADLTAVAGSETWQVAHAHRELNALAEVPGTPEAPATADGGGTVLSVAEVSSMLTDAFRGRPSRANFRTGTLTVCTMLPMRAVPHRVVCLLGLDDGVFPRRRSLDGDDLVAAEERVGDSDPRSEDRQMLLDAVLACEDRLLVVYAGADPRTGVTLPPAVPIGELMDAVALGHRSATGQAVVASLTTRHPLQPFAPANFTAPGTGTGTGTGTGAGPFSFDRAALRGARAAAAPDRPAPPVVFGTGPLTAPDTHSVGLADLVRFFGHPARALLTDRAGLYVARPDERPDEQIPVELGGLEEWGIGERLLQRRLDGAPAEDLAATEWRRGELPPRLLGQRALDRVLDRVEEVVRDADPFRTARPVPYEVLADLQGTRLSGTVTDVVGDTVLRVGYGWLSARQRLRAWIELLALTVTDPARPWRAVTVGRRGRSVLGPVPVGHAAEKLGDLVELRARGLTALLPFSPKVSEAYAATVPLRHELHPFRRRLDTEWERERDEVWARFLGPDPELGLLLAQPSDPTEVRDDLAEPTRFQTLARRVFQPLLDAEASA